MVFPSVPRPEYSTEIHRSSTDDNSSPFREDSTSTPKNLAKTPQGSPWFSGKNVTQSRNNTFPPTEPFAFIAFALIVHLPLNQSVSLTFGLITGCTFQLALGFAPVCFARDTLRRVRRRRKPTTKRIATGRACHCRLLLVVSVTFSMMTCDCANLTSGE